MPKIVPASAISRCRTMRVTRALVVALLAPSVSAAAQAPPASVRACTATLARQVPVRLDGGGSVFVEPQAVVASGANIFVAGNPTYHWKQDGSRAALVSRDSIFGIVMRPDGSAMLVPSPLAPGRVHSVRAAAHADGQWAVVFAEAAPPPRFAAPINVEAYWFGVTDGARWISLERLPTVPGRYRTERASSLVKTDRGYALALPADSPDGDRVAVFRQRDGRWSVDLVGQGAIYTSLTAKGQALILGAVYADTVTRDTKEAWTDHNSLWVYRTTEDGLTWGPRTRLVHGLGQPVHHPRFVWSGRGIELGWMATTGNGYETRIGVISPADTLSFTDRLVQETQHIEWTVTRHGRPLWLTMDNASGRGDVAWLRVWTVTGSTATQVLGVHTPFDGVVGFAVLDTTLVVVGPIRGVGPQEPAVSLHMHAFALDCD